MSDTVTFTLNEQSVTVPKGTTVMEAAKREKVSIPHFCWHKGLSIAGVCRFCMVEVEGRPKLEIACNLQATDGMVIKTKTEKVQEAHKWALEFHLINHPLDCPICDQAGECGLQKYYMKVGKYPSQMKRPKVLKPKVLDVGEELILDTERCILCSRCVRFEDEITKTSKLGIFDRGDRAIIGIYGEEKIKHNYQENLVDICPVGAFTSKKFRFKQRVWFLDKKDSICPGCSTGCHISLHGKEKTKRYYRIKPRSCLEVNRHWMCDDGRRTFEHLNPEERLDEYYRFDGHEYQKSEFTTLWSELRSLIQSGKKMGLLVSPQYTSEEMKAFFDLFHTKLGIKKVYMWRQDHENIQAFDGLLKRGDHNPNTQGMKALGLEIQEGGFKACIEAKFDGVIALAPEIRHHFPDYHRHLESLSSVPFVSLWTTQFDSLNIPNLNQLIPLKAFSEKTGTFLNHEGRTGHLQDPFDPVYEGLEDVKQICEKIQSL